MLPEAAAVLPSSWLLDPAPLARGLLLQKSSAWNVARATAADSAAYFFLSAAVVACICTPEAFSAAGAGFQVHGWASLRRRQSQLEERTRSQLEATTTPGVPRMAKTP